MFSFRKLRKRDVWDRDTRVLTFGKRDHLTMGDLYENTAIFGAPGSGKTSGSLYALLYALLCLGFGGTVLTTKVDDTERIVRIARIAGRERDVIIFDPRSGSQFNFLDYQHSQLGSGTGFTENLINLFDDLSQLAERISGRPPSTAGDQYWDSAKRQRLRSTVDLQSLAIGKVDMPSILDLLRAAPRSLAEARDPAWQSQSLIVAALRLARERANSDEAHHDIAEIERYFLDTNAKLSEKTRSIVDSMVESFLDLFGRGMLYNTFCQGSTCTPSDCSNGKIVIVNFPVKQYMALGVIAQTIWKVQFQQMLEQRKPDEGCPCFLCIDECQNFLSVRDSLFAATARSSRCASIFCTQSISNMRMAMAANDAGSAAVDTLIGLCGTKIFHQNSDAPTNQYASDLFGRRKVRMRSSSTSHPERQSEQWLERGGEFTTGCSEAFEPILEPHIFTSLRKGGPPSLLTEAIVFSGGRKWYSSRDTFLRVNFKQGF